jgi:ferrous iron transport protein A
MNSPVTNVKEGATGRIVQFTDDYIAGKLMTMGVLPGSKVEVVRIAPFNGGFYLKVDGINMVMRVQEARNIILRMDG